MRSLWKKGRLKLEIADLLANLFVVFLATLNLFPFYWMITSSIKTSAGIFKMPPDWFPASFYYQNYVELFTGQPVVRWTFNSIFISISNTLLVIVCSSMAAYALSKLNFPGKRAVFAVVVLSLMIPKEIFIVPLFKIVLALEWSDTYWGTIFPNAATCFGVFMLKGFFDSVPDSLRESGKLDGASEFTIFLRLIMPIVKPGIGALFILNFVQVWNNYLWQMLMARSKKMMTLQVGIASLMQDINPNFAYKMAGACIAALPMLLIFIFFQKYFTKGITIGAVKE